MIDVLHTRLRGADLILGDPFLLGVAVAVYGSLAVAAVVMAVKAMVAVRATAHPKVAAGWGPQDPLQWMANDLVQPGGVEWTLIDGDWAITVAGTSRLLGITRWTVVVRSPILGDRLVGEYFRSDGARARVLQELRRHETVRLLSLPGWSGVAAMGMAPNTSIMRRSP